MSAESNHLLAVRFDSHPQGGTGGAEVAGVSD
jgi:hypothetical protein